MTTALVLIALVALAAIGGIGYLIRCQTRSTETLTNRFAQSQNEIVRTHSELVAQMVLGWRDSLPSNDQPSTASPENETLPTDEPTLDAMPDHIRAAYEREALEDMEREMMTSSTSSSQPQEPSSSPEMPLP